MPLSLPHLLFCIWPRARYDLVSVKHPRRDILPLQIEVEWPFGVWAANSEVITAVVFVSFMSLHWTAWTLMTVACTGVRNSLVSQCCVNKGWSLRRDELTDKKNSGYRRWGFMDSGMDIPTPAPISSLPATLLGERGRCAGFVN